MTLADLSTEESRNIFNRIQRYLARTITEEQKRDGISFEAVYGFVALQFTEEETEIWRNIFILQNSMGGGE